MSSLTRRVPWGLVVPALLIVVIFATAHALGLRDSVSVVSGTVPAGDGELVVISGAGYVAIWLAAVVVAPILWIAAVSLTVVRTVATLSAGRKDHHPTQVEPNPSQTPSDAG